MVSTAFHTISLGFLALLTLGSAFAFAEGFRGETSVLRNQKPEPILFGGETFREKKEREALERANEADADLIARRNRQWRQAENASPAPPDMMVKNCASEKMKTRIHLLALAPQVVDGRLVTRPVRDSVELDERLAIFKPYKELVADTRKCFLELFFALFVWYPKGTLNYEVGIMRALGDLAQANTLGDFTVQREMEWFATSALGLQHLSETNRLPALKGALSQAGQQSREAWERAETAFKLNAFNFGARTLKEYVDRQSRIQHDYSREQAIKRGEPVPAEWRAKSDADDHGHFHSHAHDPHLARGRRPLPRYSHNTEGPPVRLMPRGGR